MSLNVLFITADQWRGECLGVAGHKLVKTPNIDGLAVEGTVFLNHYANAAPCSPARACLYTGLYQMTNRVVRNGTPHAHRFDNVALAARRVGYAPALFGYTDQAADPNVVPAGDPRLTTYEGVLPGFDVRMRLPEDDKPWLSWLAAQGLDFADRHDAHRPVRDAGKISIAPPRYSKEQTQTAFLADEFIRFLGEQDGKWFAHLSFLRPHPPFIVPEPYNAMYDPAEMGSFRRAATVAAEAAVHPLVALALASTGREHFVPGASGPVADLSEAEFRQIKATYFGMISEVDAQLGRVFDAIKAAGQWNDTLVIFTSDHAELLGDHYLLGKGGYHDQSQHVPLVLYLPGKAGGGRVTAFTESVDIYPTLLAAIGATPVHVSDGASLLPFLDDVQPAGWWRDAAHWEFDFRDVAGQSAEQALGLDSVSLNMAAVRTRKWKYVHFAALPPLLFDLEADPDNLVNLAGNPAYAAVQLEMAERLLSWRAKHLDQTLALTALTPEGVVSRDIAR
ncbi:MAG: phosphonate monoester hydrolase [Hyphomicrobiales bacterium]|nr:MAG: phosphonate monoester hydrolase [Hyphomicrobiales bacterium]